MSRGIRRRGEEIGAVYRQFAPADLNGLSKAFVGNVPDEGRMFAPAVLRCDDDVLEISSANCPFKNAWHEMGLDDATCALMCEIANVIDYGAFEAAGFDFELGALPQGRLDSCLLRVKKKADGKKPTSVQGRLGLALILTGPDLDWAGPGRLVAFSPVRHQGVL